MIARSYLFVPGDRPERFSKALATGAHQVVIDLEDAVALDAKVEARAQIAAWLGSSDLADAGRERVAVRVNAYGSPWHEEDVAMLRAAGVLRVMVPKAEDAVQLADIVARSAQGVELVALIESVSGVVRMREVAQCKGVARLAFGSFDFGVDAGIDVGEGIGRELDYVRSQFVIESRFAGLPPPIDGVTLATGDTEAVAAHVLDARRFGFGGKLCIHPKQVDAVNGGFAPSEAERDWATRVLAALAKNPRGAISVDGKLVDKPIVDRARRILAA